MQRAILFVVWILACATLQAQQYPFVQYTPREGLANNRAKFVFQDSKGNLYISTFGGLSIYDGTRFVNYNKTNGLGDDLVNDIVEMGEDSLWILPNAKRIQCLVKGKLRDFIPSDNYIPLINQMIKSSDGFYYGLSDDGLFQLKNNRFIRIKMGGIPPEKDKTFVQCVEINKKLYILSNPEYKLAAYNLLVYDLVLKKLVAFNDKAYASQLFSPTRNELWISTVNGVFMVNVNGEKDQSAELKPMPESSHIPKNLYAYYIYKDKQSNIWMASPRGVYKIKSNGETTLFSVENGLTTNIQNSIFQDIENNMWFTNELTGLCKLSNQQLAYYPTLKPGYAITDIYIGPSSDSVWMHDAFHHRMILLLPNGRTEEYEYPKESFAYPPKFISGNHNWMIAGNSIFRWNKAPNGKLYSLSLCFKDSSNPNGFNSGLTDKNGNLVTVSTKVVVVADNKILSEPFNYITDGFTVDKQNRVWVAPRSNQLYCFEISGNGDSTRLSLLHTYFSAVPGSPRSIVADQSGNIWIGTRDAGLFCLQFDNLTLRSIRRLSTVNGLSANFITYLFCDKDNNIWACTHSGLDRIKTEKDHFLVENITKSANLYLPVSKIQQASNGLFWILSGSGIITYKPERTPMHGWKPQLAFSEIMINNEESISMPSKKELPYFQNNLTFQLSAPTFLDEKQTRFSYMLQGGGTSHWSVPSTNATINLVNLSPGTYTLKAKAIFLHGLYPDTISSFTFTILPPWWQTLWFKLLASIMVLLITLLGLRYYINRKLELQRAILEKKRAVEKERTRIATDMHDDLGAGLSRIKFLSETIGMKKQQHLPIEEEINSIRSYSHEMIDKMGEIVWALNEKNDTLSDLLSYTRAYAVEYLEQNGITSHVQEPENIPQLNVNGEFRRNIYLTVKEALHNIVKHAEATEVLINIDITDRLSIQIKDNGKGIDNASLQSIGNGLFNMSSRIQELKGHFKIFDREGTLVDIWVPLNL